MPDFAQAFKASAGQVIDFEGRPLQPSLDLDLNSGDHLHVLFEQFTGRPVQGLAISTRRRTHRLTVAGTSHHKLVLWTDTAPRHVDLSTPRARKPIQVQLRNVWRDEKYGATMYGLNAAAMNVTHVNTREWLIRCSDGWGTEANFDDLVIRIIVEPATNDALNAP